MMMLTRIKSLSVVLLLAFLVIPSNAQQRSMDDVMQIISSSAKSGSLGSVKSKSFAEKVAVLKPSSQIMNQLMPEKMLREIDTSIEAFYIYSTGNGEGFMIVSGDERMAPVLAYAEEGDFDVNQMPDNVKAWLAGYVSQVQSLNETLTADAPVASVNVDPQGVSALLSTKWGQRYPYNNLCPIYSGTKQAVTGCVATAMAQCMNYYKYPACGTGSNSYTSDSYGLSLSRDFSANPFKWSLLKDSYSSLSSGNTAEEVEAIAELMYTCGVSVNMDYGPESGSNQVKQMYSLEQFFGYDEDMVQIHKNYMKLDDWHQTLVDELNASRPLMISGITPQGYGHAFIIDGYTPDDDDYPYYHINWGWNGSYNGDFKMNCMAESRDISKAYNQRLSAIINFKPDDGVSEYENYIQIQSVTPSASTVDLTAGEQLTIRVDTCINCLNKDFLGKVNFYLVDANGEKACVYTINLDGMPLGFFTSNEVKCTIPSSLESGTYAIEAYAQTTGSSKEQRVTICDVPDSISIINSSNIFYPVLMATAINVNKTASRAFSMSASQICNFGSTPFTGSVKMVVTDYYGNHIKSFGNSKSISNLSQYAYLNSASSFSGTLPTSLEDGAYRLYLGAQQSGYSNWAHVQKYVISGGYITESGLEGSTKFWIVNNAITLTAPFELGDVNDDNSVNIADMSALVRLILDNYRTLDYTFYAADMNEDAELNVGDFSLLVQKTLSAGSNAYAKSGNYSSNNTQAPVSVDVASINENENGNTEITLAVKLLNTERQYNAMQFDLQLPEGLELADKAFTFSSRAKGFKSVCQNGRVLLYNLTDSNFGGTEGDVVYLKLKTNGKTVSQNCDVVLNDIILSDAEYCEATSAANATARIEASELTAVSSVAPTASVSIQTVSRAVVVKASEAASVLVTDSGGVVVAQMKLKAGETATIALPAGVYVINNNKIIIR